MKWYKQWWFWLALAAFLAINLYLSHHHVPNNQDHNQLRHSHIGTH
ncbi:MAG TPA: hypothetical protein VFK37_08080 [Bacillales bacterium]|nr:hypothetical protein [Bacillales bacterium]